VNALQLHENTPDKIVTRSEGAKFYCHACRELYQKCKCRVYVSADTLHKAVRPGTRMPLARAVYPK
jgi:hypothetical protein